MISPRQSYWLAEIRENRLNVAFSAVLSATWITEFAIGIKL